MTSSATDPISGQPLAMEDCEAYSALGAQLFQDQLMEQAQAVLGTDVAPESVPMPEVAPEQAFGQEVGSILPQSLDDAGVPLMEGGGEGGFFPGQEAQMPGGEGFAGGDGYGDPNAGYGQQAGEGMVPGQEGFGQPAYAPENAGDLWWCTGYVFLIRVIFDILRFIERNRPLSAPGRNRRREIKISEKMNPKNIPSVAQQGEQPPFVPDDASLRGHTKGHKIGRRMGIKVGDIEGHC